MSEKYDFADIRDELIACVLEACPSTLENWDRSPLSGARDARSPIVGLDTKEVVFALCTLASTHERILRAALPSLYVACAKWPVGDILPLDGVDTALPLHAQRAVARGKARLHELQFDGFAELAKNTKHCAKGSSQCYSMHIRTEAVRKLLLSDVSLTVLLRGDCNPVKLDIVNSCYHCFLLVDSDMAARATMVWNNLPSYFGLPSWLELLSESG